MEKIKAKYASSQNELNSALEAGERVIIVQGNLYNEIKDVAEKYQKSKIAKTGGKVAVVLSLVLPAVVGIASIASEILSYVLGKNADSINMEDIDIDEVKKEIVLSKKRRKDKEHKDEVIER